MDRKIIGVMLTLVAVLIVVMVVVLVSVGGGLSARSGGFTKLFDQLVNTDSATYDQDLALPTSWRVGDVKSASDTIVDMYYDHVTLGSVTVYETHLYFAYQGVKWNDAARGTSFTVPQNITDLHVSHGLFHITVSSATNLAEKYQIGDVIQLENKLVVSSTGAVIFGTWVVANTL